MYIYALKYHIHELWEQIICPTCGEARHYHGEAQTKQAQRTHFVCVSRELLRQQKISPVLKYAVCGKAFHRCHIGVVQRIHREASLPPFRTYHAVPQYWDS